MARVRIWKCKIELILSYKYIQTSYVFIPNNSTSQTLPLVAEVLHVRSPQPALAHSKLLPRMPVHLLLYQ